MVVFLLNDRDKLSHETKRHEKTDKNISVGFVVGELARIQMNLSSLVEGTILLPKKKYNI